MRAVSVVPGVSEQCKECRDVIYCNLTHLSGRLSARKPNDCEQRARAAAGPVGAHSRPSRFAREFLASLRVHRLWRALRRHHSEPRRRRTVRTFSAVLLPAAWLLLLLWRLRVRRVLWHVRVVWRRTVRVENPAVSRPHGVARRQCESSGCVERRVSERYSWRRPACYRPQIAALID